MPRAALLAAVVGPVLALVLAGCGSGSPGSAGDGDPVPAERGSTTLEPLDAGETPELRDPRTPGSDPSDGTDPTEDPAEDGADGRGETAQLDDLAELAEGAEGEADRQRRRFGSGPVLGSDISWPQCPRGLGIPERPTLGLPAPLPEARYVVVGLTNGPAFTDNPCLAEQVASVRDSGRLLAAYAVTSFPDAETLAREGDRGPYDAGDTAGALANVGYRQAEYAVGLMEDAALLTPTVWVDVEPVPDFEWSDDPVANAAVVRGVVRGYADAGYEVGVYSTPLLWEGVVGDLALGLPEWRAAGETSRTEALDRCGPDWSIQGGDAVLGQWLEDSRDQNVTCPGVAGELGRWFFDPT